MTKRKNSTRGDKEKRHKRLMDDLRKQCVSAIRVKGKVLMPEKPQPCIGDRCVCWGWGCLKTTKRCNAIF